MNADVAFNTPYKRSMNILKAEKGIEKEEYLKKLAEQEKKSGSSTGKDGEDQ